MQVKTTTPDNPPKDFNEWMRYILKTIEEMRKVKR